MCPWVLPPGRVPDCGGGAGRVPGVRRTGHARGEAGGEEEGGDVQQRRLEEVEELLLLLSKGVFEEWRN